MIMATAEFASAQNANFSQAAKAVFRLLSVWLDNKLMMMRMMLQLWL
jgi:hypothetical protein